MTYYELISYLDSLTTKTITEGEIEYLNNITISLKGDRYSRFIDHINYLITQILKNYLNSIMDKMADSYMDASKLTLELSTLKEQISIANKIACIKLIEPENQNEFKKSIIKANNNIIETLRTVLDDDEERINIVNNYELKEID